jgi:hypothetical protein
LDIIESRENGAIRVVAQEQGCNSHIGYTGYNEIGLGYAGNNACGFNYGIVAHELGHALGLIHEHQRSDRDQHIRIWPEHSSMDPQRFAANWNIEPNTWGITPYDAISIMHYPPEHWSQSWGVVWRSIIILPSDPYYDYLAMQEIRQGDFDAVRSIHSGEVRGGRPQPGNGIGNYQQCPNGGTDQCSSGGFRCCIGPGDSQTGKFTCRPGNECFRGGLVPDYQTCPSFTDSCATPGFRCCVGFADAVSAATRKHTCRPNNECANGGVVPNYETCPAGERDNCATPGFRCCVGSGDASTGKLTCRPGNECLRGGVVPNYQTCPAGKADKCANAGFTCCVGAGDIGTGKHTCRPFGECT